MASTPPPEGAFYPRAPLLTSSPRICVLVAGGEIREGQQGQQQPSAQQGWQTSAWARAAPRLDLDGLEAQAPVRLAPSFVDGARVGKKRAAEAEPAAGRRAMVAHAAVYTTQPTDKARALEALVQRMARVGVCPEAAPAIEGEGLLAQLERDARARVLSTFDVGKLETAAGWCEDFWLVAGGAAGRVPLFHMLESASDISSSAWNLTTLEMMSTYMRRVGSRAPSRRGEQLKGDTIQAVVGLVRLLREVVTRGVVVLAAADTTSTRLYKSIRREDDPSAAARNSKRALRAAHFRTCVGSGFVISGSYAAEVDWAAALVAHNLLLRGGEVGMTDGGQGFRPSHGITFRHIEWRAPCADSEGLPWIIFHVVAIKDQTARNRRVPMPVQRRHDGPSGADALCTYDAVAAVWRRRTGQEPSPGCLPPAALADEPFFARSDGAAYTTLDVRVLSRRIATACGEDPEEFGGKSLRAGGATDVRDVLGAAGMPLIKQRGRWCSDVAEIYQRSILRHQLAGSARMSDACGADLESVVRGWKQPASF